MTAADIEKPTDDIEILDWDGPDDPGNPFNWSRTRKWVMTLTVCFISILTGIPAGSYGSAADEMAAYFHVQNVPFANIDWGTVTWNMGAATLPLVFVPLTESSGRMPGYFISYAVLVACMFGFAFPKNYATMLVMRYFGGGGSSISITIVSGTISDIWRGSKERSMPMAVFGLTSVIGIALGPFVGSAIYQVHQNAPWRWIWYVQIIYNGALIPVFFFILKETRSDIILKKRAKAARKANPGRQIYAQVELDAPTLWKLLEVSCARPTRMLLTEPVVASFTLWISFAWGILFLFFSSVVQTYTANYHWSNMLTGTVQLAISVGAIIGTIINPFQDWLYFKSADRNPRKHGRPIAEARLYTSIPGSLLFTGSLFWYGWSSQAKTHWIVPTIAIAASGLGIYSIYMAVVNYLADSYEKYASSALSAAALGRNTFGAFLPLASYPMFNNLGFGWAGSLVGFIAAALSIVPVVLVLKGPEIRRRSPFMREAMFSHTAEVEKQASAAARGENLQEDAGIEGVNHGAPLPPESQSSESRVGSENADDRV